MIRRLFTQLEQRNQNIKFQRIDADVTAGAKEEVAEERKKHSRRNLTAGRDFPQRAWKRESGC